MTQHCSATPMCTHAWDRTSKFFTRCFNFLMGHINACRLPPLTPSCCDHNLCVSTRRTCTKFSSDKCKGKLQISTSSWWLYHGTLTINDGGADVATTCMYANPQEHCTAAAHTAHTAPRLNSMLAEERRRSNCNSPCAVISFGGRHHHVIQHVLIYSH